MKFFNIKTTKSLGGSTSKDTWSNDYSIEVADGSTARSPEVIAAAQAILEHERVIHCSQVFIKGATISSTLKGDSGPDALKKVGPGRFGGRVSNSAETSMLPLEMVYELALIGDGGREGRKSYRGVLTVPDVVFRQGGMYINNESGGGQFLRDNGPDLLLVAALNGKLRINAPSNQGEEGRQVTQIGVAGLNFRQRDRNSRSKVVDSENSLIATMDDILYWMSKAASAITVLTAAGKITQAARLAARVATVRQLTGTLPPPPQLPGN